ncbi:hypothetical protein MMC28_002265 [Mycoblastus sanguinarius]|nr:hypothetical protein [Mycoblastus sanguinarius]
MVYNLARRQTGLDDGDDDDGDYWGYSTTATAVKWAFVAAILLLFLLWFVGGYYHAQRRLKKGLPPLAYHRFLLPHHQRTRFMPQPQYAVYPQQNGYGESYPLQAFPPPAYNAEHIPPPMYQPPEGASKANPTQDWVAQPPPGPPPGHHDEGQSSNATQTVALNHASASQDNPAAEQPIQTHKPSFAARINPFK